MVGDLVSAVLSAVGQDCPHSGLVTYICLWDLYLHTVLCLKPFGHLHSLAHGYTGSSLRPETL